MTSDVAISLAVDKDWRQGGIELAVGRIAPQIGRQVGARCIDCRLHVARGAVGVAIDAELQIDASGTKEARRRHFGDIGDLAKATFPRLATVVAMSAGLAPGKVACIEMVGNLPRYWGNKRTSILPHLIASGQLGIPVHPAIQIRLAGCNLC